MGSIVSVITGPSPAKPEASACRASYTVTRTLPLRATVERAIAHLTNWKILKTGQHRIMTDFPNYHAPSLRWRSSESGEQIFE
jgi:hypothetical protein